MTNLLVLVAATGIGIDFGWETVAGGGKQYYLRLDRETVDSLLAGENITSELPESLSDVRSVVLTTIDALPNEGKEPPRAIVAIQPGPRDDYEEWESDDGEVELVSAHGGTKSGRGKDHKSKDDEADGADAEKGDAEKTTGKIQEREPPSPSDVNHSREAGGPATGGWMPIVLMLLFFSIGLNWYLGWVHANLRRRYQSALAGLIS